MTADHAESNVVRNTSLRSTGNDKRRLKIAAVISVVALLLAAAQWPRDSDTARAAPSSPSAAEHPSSETQYFPAQYTNAARNQPPEEHIQAY